MPCPCEPLDLPLPPGDAAWAHERLGQAGKITA
jgi:hypothetical protein